MATTNRYSQTSGVESGTKRETFRTKPHCEMGTGIHYPPHLGLAWQEQTYQKKRREANRVGMQANRGKSRGGGGSHESKKKKSA